MTQHEPNTATIAQHAAEHQLALLGTLAVEPDDPVPANSQTIALFGPRGSEFWDRFTESQEYLDAAPDPIDCWSTRTIGALAVSLGGTPLFPFSSPPLPFINWALRSGRAWSSPIAMLVHDQAGLFVSFRGAIALPWAVDGQGTATKPCLSCARPCASACPVRALSETRYDVAACHTYLDTKAGRDCMENGCAARRICPVSAASGRSAAQSAFHMKAFHK